MSANLTVYRLKPNPLGQLAGNYEAPVVQPTWAANIVLAPDAGAVLQLLGNAAVSAAAAVTVGNGMGFGQLMIVIVSDTGGVTVTFSGANIKPTATVNPTTGKTIVVTFVWDGAVWHEMSRSAAAE